MQCFLFFSFSFVCFDNLLSILYLHTLFTPQRGTHRHRKFKLQPEAFCARPSYTARSHVFHKPKILKILLHCSDITPAGGHVAATDPTVCMAYFQAAFKAAD